MEEGICVFDQMPFEVPMQRIKARYPSGALNMDLLLDFYLPIFERGFIETLYFLPDWETSFGARWEHEQAQRLNMKIIYLT